MTNERETLLVIDDEKSTVELCQRLFEDKYDIVVSNSAKDAQGLVSGREIAVALVDQRMPEMTGLEFFIEFARTHPNAARIVMTGYTDLEDIVALINDGKIHGFVLKPWNNHQLRVTVDREVEGYRRARTIALLNEQLRHEHGNMLELLREFDPRFQVPASNDQLKDTKNRLRQKVADEIEKLFLEQLFQESEGNISQAARSAKINRTFLYRLMRRHGVPEEGGENSEGGDSGGENPES